MARDRHVDLAAAYKGESPAQILLLELAFQDPPIRLTNYDGDLDWAGETWSARPFQVGEQTHANQDEAPGQSVSIADLDGWWKGLQDAGAVFERKRVTIYRVDRAILGTVAEEVKNHKDVFVLDKWTRPHGAVILELMDFLGILGIEVPLRTVTRSEFPGIPNPSAV